MVYSRLADLCKFSYDACIKLLYQMALDYLAASNPGLRPADMADFQRISKLAALRRGDEHLPQSFFSIFPETKRFLCIGKADNLCSGKMTVLKGPQREANRIRTKLSTLDPTVLCEENQASLTDLNSADGSPLQMLEVFAKCCLCDRCKEDCSEYLKTTAKAWLSEIRLSYKKLSEDSLSLFPMIRQIYNPRSSTSLPGALPNLAEVCTRHSGRDDDCMALHLRRPANPGSDRDIIVLSARLPEAKHPRELFKMLFQSLPHDIAMDLKERLNPDSGFTTHLQAGTLAGLVAEKLGSQGREDGYIYVYETPETPGFVKIGYTTGLNPAERLEEWERCCGLPPTLVHSSHTFNAQRVEKLIHMELGLRTLRRNRPCWGTANDANDDGGNEVGNKRAPKTIIHNEWFEISVEQAKATVDYWVAWMAKHKPYDDEGYLRLDKRHVWQREQVSLEEDEEALWFISDSRGKFWESCLSSTTVTYDQLARGRWGPLPTDWIDPVSGRSCCAPEPSESERPPIAPLSTKSDTPVPRSLGTLPEDTEAMDIDRTPSKPPKVKSNQKPRRKSDPANTTSPVVTRQTPPRAAKLKQAPAVIDLTSDNDQTESENGNVSRSTRSSPAPSIPHTSAKTTTFATPSPRFSDQNLVHRQKLRGQNGAQHETSPSSATRKGRPRNNEALIHVGKKVNSSDKGYENTGEEDPAVREIESNGHRAEDAIGIGFRGIGENTFEISEAESDTEWRQGPFL
jgi:hypothetical protein